MATRVYIATTERPVLIERITREVAARSAVCLGRTTRVLPISDHYDAFVRSPSGVIEREFGPFPDGAFRLDVSGEFDGGPSWHLAVFAAHALVRAGLLAEPDVHPDRALWLTGEVLSNLDIKPVDRVAEKIRASRETFAQLTADGVPVTLITHPDNAHNIDTADLTTNVALVSARTTAQMCRAIGVEAPTTGGNGRVVRPRSDVRRGVMAIAGVLSVIVLVVLGLAARQWLGTPDDMANSALNTTNAHLTAVEVEGLLTGAIVGLKNGRGVRGVRRFYAGSRATNTVFGYTEEGRWWVEPNGLMCTEFRRMRAGAKLCQFVRVEGASLKYVRPNGKQVTGMEYTLLEGLPPTETFFPQERTPCQSARLHFAISDIDSRSADQLKSDACRGLQEFENWWGKTFDGELRIGVGRNVREKSALQWSWAGAPGRIELNSGRVSVRAAQVVHEIAMAVAPNQNRMLAAGLAVYAHAALADYPASPNWGVPLHVSAKNTAAFRADFALGELDAIVTPAKLRLAHRTLVNDTRVIAGSFVKYLVERYGMEKFQALYAQTPLRPGRKDGGWKLERWQQVYDKPLDALEKEWRRHVEQAVTSAASN